MLQRNVEQLSFSNIPYATPKMDQFSHFWHNQGKFAFSQRLGQRCTQPKIAAIGIDLQPALHTRNNIRGVSPKPHTTCQKAVRTMPRTIHSPGVKGLAYGDNIGHPIEEAENA